MLTIILYDKEEKLVVDKSYTPYTTSVNYWRDNAPRPSVPNGLHENLDEWGRGKGMCLLSILEAIFLT